MRKRRKIRLLAVLLCLCLISGALQPSIHAFAVVRGCRTGNLHSVRQLFVQQSGPFIYMLKIILAF